MNANELQLAILEWAKERDLLKPENSDKQFLKLVEETGELAKAILENDIEAQKDAIGDIFVVLTIYYAQIGDAPKYTALKTRTTLRKSIFRLFATLDYRHQAESWGYLNATAHLLKLNTLKCANLAYETIKNRTGKTIGGTFIKDNNG